MAKKAKRVKKEEIKEEPIYAVPVEKYRLNLGCRIYKLEGFDNIDCALVDIEKMDLEARSIKEIYAAHILQCFDDPVSQLEKWRKWLRKNGVLWIVVPEVEAAKLE